MSGGSLTTHPASPPMSNTTFASLSGRCSDLKYGSKPVNNLHIELANPAVQIQPQPQHIACTHDAEQKEPESVPLNGQIMHSNVNYSEYFKAASDDDCTPEMENPTCSAGLTLLTSRSSQTSNTKIENDHQLLHEQGYILLDKVCEALQGEILDAKDMSNDDCPVTVKKTNKKLYTKRISVQQEMNVVVEEDICKEAVILHHLTTNHKPICNAIVNFIQFFESDSAFYLVTERAGEQSLQKLTKTAHEHIANGRLKIKMWRKSVKYIFFQIAAALYWLHHDMHCCHLRLCLSSIMVSNGNFIPNAKDEFLEVNPNISVKIVDFGVSEIFKCTQIEDGISIESQLAQSNDDQKQSSEHDEGADDDDDDDEYKGHNDFKCSKHAIGYKDYLLPPKIFMEEAYDARKADIWSMGVILYELATGVKPCASCSPFDAQFKQLKEHNLLQVIQQQQHSKYFNMKMVTLLCDLLAVDEQKRLSISDILKHDWVSLYLSKYKSQIVKKTQMQRARNMRSMKQMTLFPYYAYAH